MTKFTESKFSVPMPHKAKFWPPEWEKQPIGSVLSLADDGPRSCYRCGVMVSSGVRVVGEPFYCRQCKDAILEEEEFPDLLPNLLRVLAMDARIGGARMIPVAEFMEERFEFEPRHTLHITGIDLGSAAVPRWSGMLFCDKCGDYTYSWKQKVIVSGDYGICSVCGEGRLRPASPKFECRACGNPHLANIAHTCHVDTRPHAELEGYLGKIEAFQREGK